MIFVIHGSQHLIEWDGRESGGVIGHTIRNDQFAVVEESAARINDVGHVAFPFVLVRFEPTPWLRTSHPASVSMGDPQFPSWTSSHGKVGLRSRLRSFQKWTLSENMR